jgi:hypothetical protein
LNQEFDYGNSEYRISGKLSLFRQYEFFWTGTALLTISAHKIYGTHGEPGEGTDQASGSYVSDVILSFTLDSGPWYLYVNPATYSTHHHAPLSSDGDAPIYEDWDAKSEFDFPNEIADKFPVQPPADFRIYAGLKNSGTEEELTWGYEAEIELIPEDIDLERKQLASIDVGIMSESSTHAGVPQELLPVPAFYVIESDSPEVVHFHPDCQALNSATYPISREKLEQAEDVFELAERVELSPCGSCLRMIQSSIKKGFLYGSESLIHRLEIWQDRMEFTHKGLIRNKTITVLPHEITTVDQKGPSIISKARIIIKHSGGKIDIPFIEPAERDVAYIAARRMAGLDETD